MLALLRIALIGTVATLCGGFFFTPSVPFSVSATIPLSPTSLYKFCSPASEVTTGCSLGSIGNSTLTGATAGSAVTHVTKLTGNALSPTPSGQSKLQLVFYKPLSTSYVLNNVWIGQSATSGNAWNFAAAPTRVTFGGLNSVTAAACGTASAPCTFTSDLITFTTGTPLTVAFDTGLSSQTVRTVPSATTVLPTYTGTAGNYAGYAHFITQVTASTSGTVMTVTAVATDPGGVNSSGLLKVGDTIIGTGLAANTTITSFGTGTGGAGTYNISVSQSLTSRSMQAQEAGTTLKQDSYGASTPPFIWFLQKVLVQ